MAANIIFFCAGWGIAFVIALFAFIADFIAGGGICPTFGGSGIRGAGSVIVPM